MAFSGAANKGTAVLAVAGSNFTFSPASNLTPGALVVVCLAFDNSGTLGSSPFSSIQDSKGNTWIVEQQSIYDPGIASAGVVCVIASTVQNVAQILATDTITVGFSANAVAVATITEVQGTAPTASAAGGAGSGSNTATPSIVTSARDSGEFLVACCGGEDADTWTPDGDVLNGSWFTHQHNGTGFSDSGMSLTSQVKILSGAGAQTYNPSFEFAADTVLAWVTFAEGAPPASGASKSSGGIGVGIGV